jgi:hypothetical protein
MVMPEVVRMPAMHAVRGHRAPRLGRLRRRDADQQRNRRERTKNKLHRVFPPVNAYQGNNPTVPNDPRKKTPVKFTDFPGSQRFIAAVCWRAEIPAISAISLRLIASLNDAKLSTCNKNAPDPPITLSR